MASFKPTQPHGEREQTIVLVKRCGHIHNTLQNNYKSKCYETELFFNIQQIKVNDFQAGGCNNLLSTTRCNKVFIEHDEQVF